MLGNNDIESTVKNLLNSHISAYEIEKRTGINRSQITRLRNGEILLDNTSFKTITILYEYSKKNNL